MNRLRLLLSVFTYFLLLLACRTGFAQTADFSMSPAKGCAPLVVTFTDNSPGGITSYSWNLGNSTTSTLQNPSTTYTTPGTYTISLTVNGPGGSDTKIATLDVYDQPTVSFVAVSPLAGCTPHNVQFNSTVTPNAVGAVTYNWDFGDGTTGSGANPTHTYVTPGTCTVLLTVINSAGCSRTVVQNAYVTAYPVPVGGFVASQTVICSVPTTVSIVNTSSGAITPYTTSWDFGDGGTGSGNTTSHTYTTGGNFTVTMIVNDSRGCADTVVNTSYLQVNAVIPTISGPAAGCINIEVPFVNATAGATQTFWDFGDGHTMIGSSGANIYETPGTFTVTMITTLGSCTKTATKTVTINPSPTATIAMIPPVPCPAPATVAFTASSIYAVSYAWSWANGGTASGQTVSKNYPARPAGWEVDRVKLVTTSAAGCKDSLEVDTVLIRDLIVNVLPGGRCDDLGPAGCFPLTVHFDVELISNLPLPLIPGAVCPLVLHPATANSWIWDFGDGNSGTGPTPTHVYGAAGRYVVKCTVTTPGGCSGVGYCVIQADSPVHPSFTASPLAICQNSPLVLTNTTANPLPGTRYEYYVRDLYQQIGDTGVMLFDTSRVSVNIKAPGLYTVYMYTRHGNCGDTTIRYDYITVNPPGAKFVDSIFCAPNYATVKFTNTSISSTSQFWDFGDGDTSTALNPTHTYPGMGHYFPKLIVHNNVFGCSDTFLKRVQLFIPSFDFTVTDPAICTDESVQFHATFFGYGEHYFNYYTEGASSGWDSIGNYAHKYVSKGRHDVMMIVSSRGGCLDTITKPAYILVSRPEVAYSVDPPVGCLPLTIQFSDSSGNVPGINTISRTWIFGDGDTLITSQAVVNHVYTGTGKDTVHLIVTDSMGCVSDLLAGYDSVFLHKPVAAFTVNDSTVCAYDQITVNDTSAAAAILQHQWDFGDGHTAIGKTASHIYDTPGQYSVRLIVTDSIGCMDTLVRSKYITVNAPHAAFTMSDSQAACPPLLIRFSNLSTAASAYQWDFGTGGAPVIVTNPVSTFYNPGVFNIALVATDTYGCTDTAMAQVRVLGYSGAFSYTPLAGCSPMTVTFTTPLNGIPQITWDFGDGVTNTTSNTTTTHTYTSARAYLPKVIFSDGATCASSSLGLDTIRVDQVDADFYWSVPCAGTAFTLRDSSTALFTAPGAWAWYFGGGDTAAGSPVSYTFSTQGDHPVTMVVANATGCKDTLTKDVFVYPLPIISVTNDTGVCPGDRVDLIAGGALRYTWSPTPDSLRNCPVCDIAFVHMDNTAPGVFAVYTVSGTDTNGCVNSDSTTVVIQLKTTSSTGAGGEICVGESFRLHAEGAHKYEWLPAESLDSPFIASPLATPQRTTTYIVAAQEGTCLIDSQHVQVVVHSQPLFSAGNDETIALGSAVTLKPTKSGITRIEWTSDTSLTCLDCFDPAAHPYYTRTYYATGYNEYGCSATDSVTVHVRCNGSLVFIPNTFTPNGDGKNDYFFPRGEGIERMSVFRVFNRWGELLYDRTNVALNDERAGWDGTYKGTKLPPDVYVYTMQSTCSTGDIVQWKGDITIMK